MSTKKNNKKPLWKKYLYDIDTVKEGDIIPVLCSHQRADETGCNRWLKMIVNHASVMNCTHLASGSNFDMRNQEWFCHQHKIKC